MDSKNTDIDIDFRRGKIDLFFPEPELKVGDTVVVVDDGGYFLRHPDRKILYGIRPYDGGDRYDMTGAVLRVLSVSEKLNSYNKTKTEHVIVLTDGGYSYWFSYDNEKEKSYIKFINPKTYVEI